MTKQIFTRHEEQLFDHHSPTPPPKSDHLSSLFLWPTNQQVRIPATAGYLTSLEGIKREIVSKTSFLFCFISLVPSQDINQLAAE